MDPATLCTPAEVQSVVQRFVRAFNAGDSRRLDRLFAREPGFEWYSTDAPGERLRGAAYDRATLLRYFARRHARDERLELRSFQVNGNTEAAGIEPYGNFQYKLVRSARDLAPTHYLGKGAARCYASRPDVIFVWSMGRDAG
jgi:hypothetical protein